MEPTTNTHTHTHTHTERESEIEGGRLMYVFMVLVGARAILSDSCVKTQE
jgi:hypothetical protein